MLLWVPRSAHHYQPKIPDDELIFIQLMVKLATQYGRYGYRRITAMLRSEGWQVNHKRVELLWRQEGLKVRNGNQNGEGYGSTMVHVYG